MKKQTFMGIGAIALLLAVVPTMLAAQTHFDFAHPAFYQVWDRTDSLVADHTVTNRSWFWGPEAGEPRLEPWQQSPGGQRLVQYFDKSRMELNDPLANPTNPFFVTNGLLTVELISGQMQTGEARYEDRYPAFIPMSGDPGDQTTPTYAAFQAVSNTNRGDHPAPDRRGQRITATIDREGTVGDDPSKTNIPNTDVVYFDSITHHNVPRAFWDFLNQTGQVREQGKIVEKPLISPWFYASGLPISEAYWTRSLVRGQVIDVLIQAYERRVLTFTPTNGPGFQVEMGNIGQHYYNWRYNFAGQPAPGTGTPFRTPSAGPSPIIPTAVLGSPTAGTPGPTSPPRATETPSGSPTVVPKPTETPMPGGSPMPSIVVPTDTPGPGGSPMPSIVAPTVTPANTPVGTPPP